jgi:hypothetical protein
MKQQATEEQRRIWRSLKTITNHYEDEIALLFWATHGFAYMGSEMTAQLIDAQARLQEARATMANIESKYEI